MDKITVLKMNCSGLWKGDCLTGALWIFAYKFLWQISSAAEKPGLFVS